MRHRWLPIVFATVLVGGCTAAPVSPTPSLSAVPAPSSAPAATETARPSPSTAVGPTPQLSLEPVVDGLADPVDVTWRPDDPATLFIVEQVGRIVIVRDGEAREQPFLDISGIVSAGGERGLLGIAFAPSGAGGRFFVYYTALDGRQVVASYDTLVGDADQADPRTAKVWLVMDDPFGNHNGGSLAFGPDGFLYIGTGDGGGGGDPLDSGRHLDTLLAKVLRIDVDVEAGADVDPPYEIPRDNPFIDTPDARPEIWLTGLRNPWRIRFDRATGDLWIGDVGQGDREEIDVARAGIGGLDFGWNIMEGTQCFRDGGSDCHTPDLTLPVAEYGHDQGCSVTGGTVYRGVDQPALQGRYVFADYCSGRFWILDPIGGDTRRPSAALDSGRSISAIAEDAGGELVATDHSGGELLRIVANGG